MGLVRAVVELYVQEFLFWTAFQATVMVMQNRYQRRRMYTRIALGKEAAMDVVSGESSGAQGQLFILYPLLFGVLPAPLAPRTTLYAALGLIH